MLFKTSMNFFLHKNIKEDILWTSMDKSLVWKKTLKKTYWDIFIFFTNSYIIYCVPESKSGLEVKQNKYV